MDCVYRSDRLAGECQQELQVTLFWRGHDTDSENPPTFLYLEDYQAGLVCFNRGAIIGLRKATANRRLLTEHLQASRERIPSKFNHALC